MGSMEHHFFAAPWIRHGNGDSVAGLGHLQTTTTVMERDLANLGRSATVFGGTYHYQTDKHRVKVLRSTPTPLVKYAIDNAIVCWSPLESLLKTLRNEDVLGEWIWWCWGPCFKLYSGWFTSQWWEFFAVCNGEYQHIQESRSDKGVKMGDHSKPYIGFNVGSSFP